MKINVRITTLLLLLSVLFSSCGGGNEKTLEVAETMDTTIVHDTVFVFVEAPTYNEKEIEYLKNEVAYWEAKADGLKNTVPYEHYINARRVEKVKYYISICERNPNNKKFFYGWIRRTMYEE